MYKTLRKKLIIYIIPVVFIVLTLSYHISMVNSRSVLTQELTQVIDSEKDEQSKAIEDIISRIEGSIDIFAAGIGSTYPYLDADIYNSFIVNMLEQDVNLLSAGVWFEPYVVDENQKYTHYFVEDSNGTFTIDENYNSSDFDYLNNELYKRCKEENSGFFSESHYHQLTKTYTITYVSPIKDLDGKFVGCVSTSLNIEELKLIVDNYNNEDMTFYITDSTGVYIGHTDLELVKSRSNILDYSEDFTENAETILSTEYGSFTYDKDGEETYIYYDTITDFNWKLIYEVPATYINKPIMKLTIINFIIYIISISVIIGLIIHVSSVFVHTPLQLLLSEFKNISNNYYESNIPKQLSLTATEFSDIGDALNEMKSNLMEYQSKLEDKNNLLLENEKTLNDTVNYVNAIIGALPIMMFIFDRDGHCVELHGNTPFSDRPKEFYEGKHYLDLINDNNQNLDSVYEFLDAVKTIDYSDGVVQKEITLYINGNLEYFEHHITLCGNDVIISLCKRMTDTVNHIQDMKYLSEFDELTGLYNSRYFIDVVKKHVEECNLPISIIVCDINGLKAINDKYGFEEGDKILVDFTKILNEIDVENKTVSRVAGDEFAVILPNTTKVAAEKIIEDICELCISNKVSNIPFSIGYGVDTALTENDSLLHLIKSVEELLYKQKVYTSNGKKDNSISLINNVLLAKNQREQLHSNRVSELCSEMAKALGWSQLEQNKMKTAGLLHDIGKIGIPEALLNKPGKLTDEEYKVLSTHPEIGYRILQSFENMKDLSEYAYSHHEKWDGTGYPRGLKGDEIPIEARMIAIADTYDAMTSARSYREGLPKAYVIAELINCKNTQFDPALVDLFIEKVLNEKIEDYQPNYLDKKTT